MPKSQSVLLPIALAEAQDQIVNCQLCPRLREYGERIGRQRRRAYIDQEYWAKPVPGFGDPLARILILGLAPGAHGANRTGRPFTGDGSGDFMFPILHDLGFASHSKAIDRNDGLRLRNAWIASALRCAPPGDKPTPEELRACSPHLASEITALTQIRIVVCLGKIAWDAYLAHLVQTGTIPRRSPYQFSHNAEYLLPNQLHLLGCYHPSLRNTLTGRLDAPMFASVFLRAKKIASRKPRALPYP
jgi:uracil-DNA glycosylase family 4